MAESKGIGPLAGMRLNQEKTQLEIKALLTSSDSALADISTNTASTVTELQTLNTTDFSTEAKQDAQNILIGAVTEVAPANDTASSGLNGRLQRIAQNITSLIALLPTSLGQKTMANSLAVVLASDQSTLPVSGTISVTGVATEAKQDAQSVLLGAVNEAAPGTDTASSGLNGRLQRIAQNLTSSNTWLNDIDGYVSAYLDATVSSRASESTLSAQNTLIGAVNEAAPGTDTASSGLNGRLQRIAQRLTSIFTAQSDGTQKSQIVDSGGDVADVITLSNVPVSGNKGLLTQSILHGLSSAGGGTYIDVKVNPAGKLLVINEIDQTTPGTTNGVVVNSSALPTGAATSAKQDAEAVLLGAVNETAPISDTASSGLNGRLQRIAQNITGLSSTLATESTLFTVATDLADVLAEAQQSNIYLSNIDNDTSDIATGVGIVTEVAPGTDTASSGLNGRLQRIAQRLTTLLAVFPTTIDTNSGNKSASTIRVVLATDQPNLTTALNVDSSTLATAANQSSELTLLGAVNETAPANDTASSGLNGRLQRIAQRLTSLIALFPTALGSAAAASSFAVTASTEDVARQGIITEAAPASDTASSGQNGRLQRIAQRLTSLIALWYTQGSTTSGQSGLLTMGAVTTAAPSYTTAQTSPLSLSTGGALRTQVDNSPTVFTRQSPTSGSTGALSRAASTAYATNLVVKASAGRLYAVTGYSSRTSAQFIQVHNTTSLPADTAVPVYIFRIEATSNFSLDFPFGDTGTYWSTGITICNSSTGPTKTVGSADCWIVAEYI